MDENMLRMQQEAAERVRKMQERARKFVEDEPTPVTPVNREPIHVPRERSVEPAAAPLRIVEDNSAKDFIHRKSAVSFLSGLGEDKEQLFLLLIAILLVKNEAPIELVIALLYIAM